MALVCLGYKGQDAENNISVLESFDVFLAVPIVNMGTCGSTDEERDEIGTVILPSTARIAVPPSSENAIVGEASVFAEPTYHSVFKLGVRWSN